MYRCQRSRRLLFSRGPIASSPVGPTAFSRYFSSSRFARTSAPTGRSRPASRATRTPFPRSDSSRLMRMRHSMSATTGPGKRDVRERRYSPARVAATSPARIVLRKSRSLVKPALSHSRVAFRLRSKTAIISRGRTTRSREVASSGWTMKWLKSEWTRYAPAAPGRKTSHRRDGWRSARTFETIAKTEVVPPCRRPVPNPRTTQSSRVPFDTLAR